jgi:hypothetical protein
MIGMRPHVYQFRSYHSPSVIMVCLVCLGVILWVNWLDDILANFLFAGSGQNGNGQGGHEKKKEEKKEEKKEKRNPPTSNKTKSKGKRKSDIDTE